MLGCVVYRKSFAIICLFTHQNVLMIVKTNDWLSVLHEIYIYIYEWTIESPKIIYRRVVWELAPRKISKNVGRWGNALWDHGQWPG